MSTRASTFLYAIALGLVPVSVAVKPLLGLDNILWVDPTLIFSLLSLLLLGFRWNDFLSPSLRIITLGCGAIMLLAFICSISGFVLHPTSKLYDVIREPLRLLLNLCWMLVSCWFLANKPKIVVRFACISIIFALFSGIYLYLVVFGFIPAPASVVFYMRIYFIRQVIWLGSTPIPRMGGLFIEAPPFGLFMFSMLAVLLIMRRNGFRDILIRWGSILAALGILLSMADQVLLGSLTWIFVSLPEIVRRRSKATFALIGIAVLALGFIEIRSFLLKENTTGSNVVTYINGSSIGERDFHLKYGLSLLQSLPTATIFGIGPGRYGEYAAETGDYPSTVNMQIAEPEILVEWGIVGLLVWAILISFTAIRVWSLHRYLGVGLLFGLIIADSFQANWKYEAFFLAIAALCTPKMPAYSLNDD